jgi:hypothetical protein
MSTTPETTTNTPNTPNTAIKSYRIAYPKPFSTEMAAFSKIHKDKSSKPFRQEWKIWVDQSTIQEFIDETLNKNPSITKITLYDKIYESMRYHHRKKLAKHPPQTTPSPTTDITHPTDTPTTTTPPTITTTTTTTIVTTIQHSDSPDEPTTTTTKTFTTITTVPATKTIRKKNTAFSNNFIKLIQQHVQQNYHEKAQRAYEQFVQTHTQEIEQEKTYLKSKYDEIHLYDLDHEHKNVHLNIFKRNYKTNFQKYKSTL